MFFICFFMPPLHPLNETVSEYHGTHVIINCVANRSNKKHSIFLVHLKHMHFWYLIFRYKKQQASHVVHPLAMESRGEISVILPAIESISIPFQSISAGVSTPNAMAIFWPQNPSETQSLQGVTGLRVRDGFPAPMTLPLAKKGPGNSQSPAYCLGHVFGQLAHPTESQAVIIQVLNGIHMYVCIWDHMILACFACCICSKHEFMILIVYISVCYHGTWKMVVQ